MVDNPNKFHPKQVADFETILLPSEASSQTLSSSESNHSQSRSDQSKHFKNSEDEIPNRPVLCKLDTTRDLKGAFYVPGNWRSKHRELGQELSKYFQTTFKDNGNSMNSCFQFDGGWDRLLKIRVKYYWKTLELLQSKGAAKSLGMNTLGLFCPSVRMGQSMAACGQQSMSRIEITYTAQTMAAQAQFFDDEFLLDHSIHLEWAR